MRANCLISFKWLAFRSASAKKAVEAIEKLLLAIKLVLTLFYFHRMKFIAILIVIYAALASAQVGSLNEFKNWKSMDFKFPTEAMRQQAINGGNFVASNVIPIDVAADYRGEKYFWRFKSFSKLFYFFL
jgi:hypothetical protein